MITSYQTTRLQNVTTVRVTTSLTGTVYFHWYLDGRPVGSGTSSVRSFYLAQGVQVRIDVLDTTDPAFDAAANAPAAYPARRTLWWLSAAETGPNQLVLAELSLHELATLSLDELAGVPLQRDEIARYRIEQSRGDMWSLSLDELAEMSLDELAELNFWSEWSTLGNIFHRDDQWTYQYLTDALDDLTVYRWRIVPVDRAGNDGTPVDIGPEKLIRTPDAPNYTISFDPGSSTVTFTAAG
jgi:hypothetical protein